jgi:murein DD-endopeptidase MepM/ murein hydrolase activator NlpD
METKLFSPLLSSANNIVKMKRSLPKRARDYNDFINWLDTSNKDIKKIKLPKKKKVEDLQFSVGSALGGGGGGGGLLNLLLGGAAGLGARFLGKGIKAVKGFGKSAISKIFPKSAGSVVKKAAVPTADVATDLARKGVASGADDAAKVAAMKGGGKLASKGGELAAKLIPGLATAVNLGISGYRFSQGDVVGGSLSLASAIPILGWAAVGVDVAREFGAFEGTPLGLKKEKPKNKIDERLKAQETKQREAAFSSDVTFASITDKFDKVVSKFEKLKLGMTGIGSGNENNGKGEDEENPYQEPEKYPPIDSSNQTYDGPVSGDTFFPLPGGKAGESANQQFGADRARGKGSHAGLDMTHHVGALNAPVAAYKTGKVVASVSNGYNGYVTIDHGGGLKTRYYHTSPLVKTGDVVYGGQQIANLYPAGDSTHLHFEVYRSGTAISPKSAGLGQKIPAPLSKEKAKQQHEKTIGNTAKPGVNTTQRQQSPEEFFKGTKQEDIFKDKEKRAQFFGEERQFKNTMVKTPVSDPEVKQALQMYNAYVRDIRSRRQDQVKAQPGDPIPAQILTPPPTAAQQSAIFLMGDQSQQVASQPQVVPIPIGNGGGGGGVAVIMPSEGQILNSLWTTMLLTNLSSA